MDSYTRVGPPPQLRYATTPHTSEQFTLGVSPLVPERLPSCAATLTAMASITPSDSTSSVTVVLLSLLVPVAVACFFENLQWSNDLRYIRTLTQEM